MKRKTHLNLIKTKAYSPVFALMGGYNKPNTLDIPQDVGATISASKESKDNYGRGLVRKQSSTRKFLDKGKKIVVKGE